ncbi:MAG TPA: SDR family oxidoreductase [Hyphomicrobiaceae bacterium]|jgi:NAD(P)-dependent dehydrogenase (short-subunit alcohol dehydrogenase family)|nr:SDR family oxidoreductase [Hyphomicrobiaceae bacterium]
MASKSTSKPVCLVVGAGDALGGAIARRFAREGYHTCVARRTADKLADLVETIEKAGGSAAAYGCDARREDEVVALFEQIEREHGPIEVLAHNIGGNVRESILDATAQKFFKTWEMACMAGFLTGREAARRMVPRERGTILFTGATASLRGGVGFAGFSAGKAGLRMVAQSMSRELGPKGIHVAHVVIDGGIDTAFIRENFPQRYALKERDGILNPDHIAENYWMLHKQPRDAWTFELDLRPWIESW